MTELSRRSVLTGAASIAAASAVPIVATSPADAAAPTAGKQAPGFYRYKVGGYELTQIHDGALTFPIPNGWVRNISKDEALAAAEAAYMPKGKVVVPFNPVVINTGSKLVLIDSGFGAASPAAGQLQANLASAGIDAKAIDIVILSHLHPDHINGVKTKDNKLAFPNAEIKVPAPDWAFWMSEENSAKAQSNPMMKAYFGNVRRVLADIAGKLTKYEANKEVAPGITSIATHGHTPGHMSFAVASGSSRALVQSDVTNIPEFFLRHPDWHVAFDIDPIEAAKTRHKFYDMAVAEKAPVVGFHFPFPSVGHVEKDGTGYRLIPISWSATL